MQKREAQRQTTQGVQILLFKDGPYVEVAERIRAVHKAGKAFSFDRGEVRTVNTTWIYRAYITIDGMCYIGDAEIFFDAPKDTPHGTNPLTCGQTAAIGNALAFAGFGTLKSILARFDQCLETEEDVPKAENCTELHGVEVVLLDTTPYVAVAERIYWMHQTHKAFSFHTGKILYYNGVWLYRASITVDGKPYIGDAEIFFDAPKDTPDGVYPVSCGQTSAVGNALAFAGFGNVQSILECLGKEEAATVFTTASLASADAVVRAKEHASRTHEAARTESKHSQTPKATVSIQQQTMIHDLCERLGETEPNYAQITDADAEMLLLHLQHSAEELFLVAEEARPQDAVQEGEPPTTDVVPQPAERISKDAVGMLKQLWLTNFKIVGTVDEKRAKWVEFKRNVCMCQTTDDALSSVHHKQLYEAIVAEQTRKQGVRPQTAKPSTQKTSQKH